MQGRALRYRYFWLAVVAIARTVAKALDCEVGGDVGYHIGHSNVSDHNSKRSRIVFKTAGVLLEQMRDKGMAALQYKVELERTAIEGQDKEGTAVPPMQTDDTYSSIMSSV
ncbi:zinc finger CCCH domain-containing protein 4 isoform X2 [Carex littledalei]|uniref:Zinc finger CCCH domain-containing protein 4 isoform X2 n=1 Tax=Carex littledalei TaxID=544730 RepID=A0A833R3Y7_9POAL|nr:zinc finger CCCH domain-containing protein 4 isoform X2 [Carex littledalei]